MSEWHFKKYGYEKYTILNDDGHEQATTHEYDNANLIAAAPELYGALELICHTLSDGGDVHPESPIGRGLSALSKARGEHK